MDVVVEWADGWGEPQAVEVDSPQAVQRVLGDIEKRSHASGVATAADILCGDAVFTVVLGLGDIAFVQWMDRRDGAYLAVDTDVDEPHADDVVAFSALGHYSEVPRSYCVPRDHALAEVDHFVATGGLTQRWAWSGFLGDTPAPEGARLVNNP